jgi:DNA-binding NarL/FixJ family response regulator
MTAGAIAVTERDLATLLAHLETGSHKKAPRRLGIAESTYRKRVARVMGTVKATNVTQAVWRLRSQLAELEAGSGLS